MRATAVVILGICVVLTGQYFSHRLILRVNFLEKIEFLLTTVMNEVNYLATPSTELILKLAQMKEFEELKFLSRCLDEISSGVDFNKAWSLSVNDCSVISSLNKKDIMIIESFGNAFGTTDTYGQRTLCCFYIEEIKNNLSDARCKKSCYANLFMGLGMMCGIGVVIVLL